MVRYLISISGELILSLLTTEPEGCPPSEFSLPTLDAGMSDAPIHLIVWKSEPRMRYYLHSPIRPSTNLNIGVLNGIAKNKVAYCSIAKTGNSELSHCC